MIKQTLVAATLVATISGPAFSQVTLNMVRSATTVDEFLALGGRRMSANEFRNRVVGRELDEGGWVWFIIRHLRRFAEADAFRLTGHINSSAYAVGQVVNFLLPAWQVLREYPSLTEHDRTTIEDWLLQLLKRNRQEQPAKNNHLTAIAMNLALAGVLFDRPDWLQKGIRDGYHTQLRQIRHDGSFPLETARGQRAIVYQARNIAHLLIIAETARAQGIDLYVYAPNGPTIHDAVRFMLAAVRDNSVIDKYAVANEYVPDKYAKFRRNAQENPFHGHDTSWVPIYAHRFPESDITHELRRLKPATANQGIRYSAVGGNVTCMVGY